MLNWWWARTMEGDVYKRKGRRAKYEDRGRNKERDWGFSSLDCFKHQWGLWKGGDLFSLGESQNLIIQRDRGKHYVGSFTVQLKFLRLVGSWAIN